MIVEDRTGQGKKRLDRAEQDRTGQDRTEEEDKTRLG